MRQSRTASSTHTIRARDGGTVEVDGYTRGRAIKLFCTECLGWGEVHPKDCTDTLCPLFPYRGKTQTAYGVAKCDSPGEGP